MAACIHVYRLLVLSDGIGMDALGTQINHVEEPWSARRYSLFRDVRLYSSHDGSCRDRFRAEDTFQQGVALNSLSGLSLQVIVADISPHVFENFLAWQFGASTADFCEICAKLDRFPQARAACSSLVAGYGASALGGAFSVCRFLQLVGIVPDPVFLVRLRLLEVLSAHLLGLAQVWGQVLAHAQKGALVDAQKCLELCIAVDKFLVVGVLQPVLFRIVAERLDNLGAGLGLVGDELAQRQGRDERARDGRHAALGRIISRGVLLLVVAGGGGGGGGCRGDPPRAARRCAAAARGRVQFLCAAKRVEEEEGALAGPDAAAARGQRGREGGRRHPGRLCVCVCVCV
jgi:hypothetical protein